MTKKKSVLAELKVITDFFDLGTVQHVRKVQEGVNANYAMLTDRGKYFVKIDLEGQTLTNRGSEACYVNHLLVHGLPVVPYLTGRDSSFLYKGPKTAMVQPFVHGTSPYNTLSTVSQIGRMLGKMSTVPSDNMPSRIGWLSSEYMTETLLLLRTKFAKNHKAKLILRTYATCTDFKQIVIPQLPKSIIHGDLHRWNTLFRDGQLQAVVDWEDVTVAPALFDFVSTAAYWCLDEHFNLKPKLYRAFRDNYESQRPLTVMEELYINRCQKYVGLAQTLWRFRQPDRNDYDALWGIKLLDLE